jgi:CheY-like chemotaxis protein
VWARIKGIPVPRILVADDNTNIQKMVALAFEERGIEVTAVGNGEAAVRRLPDLNPDIVLADVFMPVRNGYEVCEFVKKDPRFAHIPVILLVGAFDPLDEKEARRVGADGVLKKPFVPPDPLIAMVTSALEKNPKLAAELARAKEAPVMPPAPPEPILESPMKREPVPLPDFPEPTPEEAAQIYGFGKGVRALDDVENAKEAKAPVKSPDEDEDDYNEAATSRDWRRTAGMDLEIPEGTTQESAQASSDPDFAPITFPSERDVPPRRVPARKVEEIKEVVAQDAGRSPAEVATADMPPATRRAPEPAIAAGPVREPKLAPALEIPAAKFVEAEKEVVEKEVAAKNIAEPEIAVAPALTFPVDKEPAPAARSKEWMDMMAPPPAEYPAGGWFTDSQAVAEETPSASAAELHPEAHAETEAQVSGAEAALHDADAPPMLSAEGQGASSWFSVPPPMQETIQETVREAMQEVSVESASRPAPDFGHEILVAPADADHSSGNGQRESVPGAVSSLFSTNQVSDEASKEAREQNNGQPTEQLEYVPHQDEVPVPTQHLLPPPPDTEELLAHAEASLVESDSSAYSERIPTAPPPNREALADIPFLLPPPPPPPFDSSAVDAVVQRVLEKLEPQLHDLLSKGVLKPLIENMLQQELHKNDK